MDNRLVGSIMKSRRPAVGSIVLVGSIVQLRILAGVVGQ